MNWRVHLKQRQVSCRSNMRHLPSHRLDLVVEDDVIIEIKAMTPSQKSQSATSHLTASSGLSVGLLIFNVALHGVRRVVAQTP